MPIAPDFPRKNGNNDKALITVTITEIVIVDLQGILEDGYDKYPRLVDYHLSLVRELEQHGILSHDLHLAALDPAVEQRYGDGPTFERAVKRIRIPEVPGFLFLGDHCLIASHTFFRRAESLLFTPSGARLASLPIALFNISNLLTFH